MIGIRISNDQAKFAAKNIKAKCIACELLVKRVVTLGVVLYRNQRPVYFIIAYQLLFLSDTKIVCLEIIFSNVI